VSVDERVPGLGLVGGTVGEAEVPPGVLLPRVPFEVGVLVARARLDLPPVAVEDILTAVNEALGLRHRVRVDGIRSHDSILAWRRGWSSVPVVAQAGEDAATAVARTYREFARHEARGRSAAYEALAESVAGDAALVSFIASLPPDKRQPNL